MRGASTTRAAARAPPSRAALAGLEPGAILDRERRPAVRRCPDDLRALLAATPAGGIALVEALDGTTNALSISAPEAFAPLYGRDSAARFRAHARELGLESRLRRDPEPRRRRRHARGSAAPAPPPRPALAGCARDAAGRGGAVKVVVLSGGVGGARFVRGLVDVADPRDVTVIGNVGDDLEVLGMHVSPDLDSILYALAGPERRGARLGPRRRDVERARDGRGARRRVVVPRSATAISASISCARRRSAAASRSRP